MTADGVTAPRLAEARALAEQVRDPEMPMLTLADLGVLRAVQQDGDALTVTITPTYSGCPAMATMRDDLVHTLRDHGFPDVRVAVSLHPAWSSDWVTERGRAALVAHGISAAGPVPLTLVPTRRPLSCPRCGSDEVRVVSEFGPTACKAGYRCTACLEPLEHVKEI